MSPRTRGAVSNLINYLGASPGWVPGSSHWCWVGMVGLGLLPSVYQGIEDIQAGSLASDALPPGLVLAMACALAGVLYGIVALAIIRTRSR